MNLFTFLIRFGTGVAALLWVHVWKWAYPQSAAVVKELARKEIDLLEGDLNFGVDFRGVYGTMVERWMGLDAKPVVGGTF